MAEPRETKRTISREQNEAARRAARYTFAKRRIQQIVAAAPPFTDAQRAELALILCPAAASDAPAT